MIVSRWSWMRCLGVMIILACASFVCTLFVNYRIDLVAIEDQIMPGPMQIIYDGQIASSNVVLIAAGCSLVSVALVVLFFTVLTTVEQRAKEIGVLKALGYRSSEIAVPFAVFGLSAFAGSLIGAAGAYFWLPTFYSVMNEDHIFPDIDPVAHLELLLYTVFIPALLFAGMSIAFAYRKVRQPAVSLLRSTSAKRAVQRRKPFSDMPFLALVPRSILRFRKSLVFFMFIGGFCFGAMLQMGPSMDDLSSPTMGAMVIIIGIVLAVTSILLASMSAVRSEKSVLVMMHAVGYARFERMHAVFGVFRPFAYIGFAVGTAYQYILLRLMVDVFFADFPDMPEYAFDLPVFFAILTVFVVFYELTMLLCARSACVTPLREVMAE